MKRGYRGLCPFIRFGLIFLSVLSVSGVGVAAAQTEGTVVIATASDLFRIANPAIFRLSSVTHWQNMVFNGLTKPAGMMAPEGDLAESWTAGKDRLTYTFNLRKGVKWHDGKPFTAEDVKFTYEVLMHKDNPAGFGHSRYYESILGAAEYRAGKAGSVKGVEVLGPHRIRVRLKELYSPFLMISAIHPIVPKHILGNVPVKAMRKHAFTHKPIGTGPYSFVSWKSRDRAVLRRNPNYFGKKPKIETVIWRTMPDSFSRLAALRTGALNVNGLYAAVPVDEFKNVSRDACCRGVRMSGHSNWYMDLNLKNPIFQDVRVRHALSYAIDRKAILKHVFKGWGTISNSPFHPLSWAYKKDVSIFDGDPGKAKALLEEAGWKAGPDGIRVKDGKRLGFTWLVASGRAAAIIAQAAIPMLKAVGMDVKLKRLTFVTAYFKFYLRRKYDAFSHLHPNSLMISPEVALEGYDPRRSKTGYRNPRVNALIKKGTRTFDRRKRKQIYDKLQEILAKDAVRLWLLHTDELWGVSRNLVLPNRPTGYLKILAIDDWSWKK